MVLLVSKLTTIVAILTIARAEILAAQATASAAIGLPVSAAIRDAEGIFYAFSVGTPLKSCSCEISGEWLNATVPTSSGGRALGVNTKFYLPAQRVRPYLVLGAAAYGLSHKTSYGLNGGGGVTWRIHPLGIFGELRFHSRSDMTGAFVGVRFH